jgi:hypothetical protein
MNWLVVVDLILLVVVFLLSTYTLSMKHRIDHIEAWLEDHFNGDIDFDDVAKEFGFIFEDEEEDNDESEKS